MRVGVLFSSVCVVVSVSLFSGNLALADLVKTIRGPIVQKSVDDLIVDAAISESLSSSTVDFLSDCALTYQILSNTSYIYADAAPKNTILSAKNLLRKSHYFDRALHIRMAGQSTHSPFVESSNYRSLLLTTEAKAINENPELVMQVMDLVFAKDQECSFLLSETVDKFKERMASEIEK